MGEPRIPPPGHEPARETHDDEPWMLDAATLVVLLVALALVLAGSVCLALAGRQT